MKGKIMRSNLIRCVALAAALVATGLATGADALVSSQTETDQVMFSGLDFADFSTRTREVLSYPSQGAWGTSLDATFTGTTNVIFFSTGSVSFNPTPPSGDVSSYVGTITSTGGPGTWGVGFDFAGPGGYLTAGVANGLHTLTFAGGALIQGGTQTSCTIDVLLPGDWSASGESTGDHTFNGVDPSFSVVDDFTYNSITNTTEVEYASSTYQGGFADLDFTLYGSSAVPEPAAWAVLILGLAGTGLALRRRRAVVAA